LSIVVLKMEDNMWKEIDRNPDEDCTFSELDIACPDNGQPEYCVFVEQMAKGGH